MPKTVEEIYIIDPPAQEMIGKVGESCYSLWLYELANLLRGSTYIAGNSVYYHAPNNSCNTKALHYLLL